MPSSEGQSPPRRFRREGGVPQPTDFGASLEKNANAGIRNPILPQLPVRFNRDNLRIYVPFPTFGAYIMRFSLAALVLSACALTSSALAQECPTAPTGQILDSWTIEWIVSPPENCTCVTAANAAYDTRAAHLRSLWTSEYEDICFYFGEDQDVEAMYALADAYYLSERDIAVGDLFTAVGACTCP